MILQLLNVLIGLTLIYLIFSTVASALFELIETVLKRRSQLLRLGVQQILLAADKAAERSEAPDESRVKTFYDHALIYGLYGGNYDKASRKLPSYIPPERFARAVLMLAVDGGKQLTDAERLPFENLKKLAEQLVGQDAVLDTQARAKAVEAALIQQYNDTMDRVTGWFRRYSKQWLIGIGFFLAAFANADTVQMIRVLAMDPVLAERIADGAADIVDQRSKASANGNVGDSCEEVGTEARQKSESKPASPVTVPTPLPADAEAGSRAPNSAEASHGDGKASETASKLPVPAPATNESKTEAAGEATSQSSDLGIDRQLCAIKANRALAESLGLPIGWSPGDIERLRKENGFEWFKKIFGLFLTGLAISFGAPFWFDLLNKLVSLRSSLKPKNSGDDAAPKTGT